MEQFCSYNSWECSIFKIRHDIGLSQPIFRLPQPNLSNQRENQVAENLMSFLKFETENQKWRCDEPMSIVST